MKKTILSLALMASCAYGAENLMLRMSAEMMAADKVTGEMVATGSVHATVGPVTLRSGKVSKQGDVYTFTEGTTATTCTNAPGHECWRATGFFQVNNHPGEENFTAKNVVVEMFGIPVGWVPYWWQPYNTDYGWRVMPGYAGRWGAFLLTKYVYPIVGSMEEGQWGLRGATRFDMRTKNGFALGQSVRWNLGDFGKGKFKVYYAWDNDHDRYDTHWNSRHKWNYENWGTDVDRNRYVLSLQHRWDATEKDYIRLRGSYYSDSHFQRDFLRKMMFGVQNKVMSPSANEIVWEHQEEQFLLAATVSGPINDFYGGVAKLPEVYFDVEPQPLFGLPINYESESSVGFLNRDYALAGKRLTNRIFRYNPGPWADYQTFRGDTYHRFTLPMKFADVLSVVSRAGIRGTWWSDSGTTGDWLNGRNRTTRVDETVTRMIIEGGITFAARGTAWIDDEWQHMVEPYADITVQKANYNGLKKNTRPFIFDSVDTSVDWLDQFAGRSRNLPYTWYGITPGVRNAFRKVDENGNLRTIFDIDAYATVQFNDTKWRDGDKYHRHSKDPEDPNYGRDGGATVNPGVRARWFATRDTTLGARAEWDGENDVLAYADVYWRQVLTDNLKFNLSFSSRDQRWWDFVSTEFDATRLRHEDFNWYRSSILELEFEYELCDQFAIGPSISWDFSDSTLDEAGIWFEYRTDCLGFRLTVSYDNDFVRIDGSESDHDWRVVFGIYLRALGASSMNFGD